MTTASRITVRVPLAVRRSGGRKLVVAPEGSAASPAPARAHRWQRLLEEGRYCSLSELAAAEKTDRSYPGKLLRPTLLAPAIVEGTLTLDGNLQVWGRLTCQPGSPAHGRSSAPAFPPPGPEEGVRRRAIFARGASLLRRPPYRPAAPSRRPYS